MPLYEYKCSKCGETFEKLVRSSLVEIEVCCPKCGSNSADRLISLCGSFSSSGSSSASMGSSGGCANHGGGG